MFLSDFRLECIRNNFPFFALYFLNVFKKREGKNEKKEQSNLGET